MVSTPCWGRGVKGFLAALVRHVPKLQEACRLVEISGPRVLSALLIFWGATSSNAIAQTAMHIETVPTAWLLQDYVGGPVVVYFTGSPCQSGSIVMPASATSDEQNRFFSLIMSAKISDHAVGIYYTYDGASCAVTSFYLKNS